MFDDMTHVAVLGKRGSTDKSNGCMAGTQVDDVDDGMTYLPYCNANQRIHCDYPNHSLVMPPPWNSPEVVSIIVYYDDSELTGGQTCVVPRTGLRDPAYSHLESDSVKEPENPLLWTPGARGDVVWINDRDHAEKYLKENHPDIFEFRKTHLYPREKKVQFREGSVLLYRHDMWHRYGFRKHSLSASCDYKYTS